MKFTLKEWNFIQHCIEVAGREFEAQMLDSKPSDKEFSMYQIFKWNMEQARELASRIENAEI